MVMTMRMGMAEMDEGFPIFDRATNAVMVGAADSARRDARSEMVM